MNDKVIENIEYMINRTISQIDLLTKTLSLSPIRQYKKLIYVAPVELDHALEDNESKCKEVVE